MMMERFIQPTNDPLALVSNASIQQYPTQSSMSQSTNQPSPADNFQLDSGSSSTENLIESLTNSLSLLTQSYKSNLPQTNNQLRTSSNARNKATVQDGRVVVQDVRGAGNAGGQNRVGNVNPGQAKPIKCYNCNGLGHIAPWNENRVTNFDDDVDDPPEQDLALNVDHVFEADQLDAFDSDVDEAPTTHTMFMANLTSEDPIFNKGRHHDVHEMQNNIQQDYVVDSEADYTSDSNIISYDQYVEDNAEHVVQIKFAPPDYLKENYLAIFAPQRDLTPEQIFWAKDENDGKKVEASVLKPLSTPIVYPPNTPVKLVLRMNHTQQGSQKGKEVLNKQKDVTSLKSYHFSKLLNNTLKEFKRLSLKKLKKWKKFLIKCQQRWTLNYCDKQCAKIERKNLLIANENLIANCLSNQLMFVVEQSRCLDLEAEISKLQNENQKDVNDEMIRGFNKLEVEYLEFAIEISYLQENFGNNKSQTSQDVPEFDSFFELKI
ncbi:hypothetical protein Tco_0169176 [Tanacetum coccineum]